MEGERASCSIAEGMLAPQAEQLFPTISVTAMPPAELRNSSYMLNSGIKPAIGGDGRPIPKPIYSETGRLTGYEGVENARR